MTRLRLFEPGPAEELLKRELNTWRHNSHDPWLHVIIDHVDGTFDAYFEDTSSTGGSTSSWDRPEEMSCMGKIIKGKGFSVKRCGQEEGYRKDTDRSRLIRVLRPTSTDIWIHRIRKWCEMSNSKLLAELRKIALEYQQKEQRAVRRFIDKVNAKRAKESKKQRRDNKNKNKNEPSHKTSKKRPNNPSSSTSLVTCVLPSLKTKRK